MGIPEDSELEKAKVVGYLLHMSSYQGENIIHTER